MSTSKRELLNMVENCVDLFIYLETVPNNMNIRHLILTRYCARYICTVHMFDKVFPHFDGKNYLFINMIDVQNVVRFASFKLTKVESSIFRVD